MFLKTALAAVLLAVSVTALTADEIAGEFPTIACVKKADAEVIVSAFLAEPSLQANNETGAAQAVIDDFVTAGKCWHTKTSMLNQTNMIKHFEDGVRFGVKQIGNENVIVIDFTSKFL